MCPCNNNIATCLCLKITRPYLETRTKKSDHWIKMKFKVGRVCCSAVRLKVRFLILLDLVCVSLLQSSPREGMFQHLRCFISHFIYHHTPKTLTVRLRVCVSVLGVILFLHERALCLTLSLTPADTYTYIQTLSMYTHTNMLNKNSEYFTWSQQVLFCSTMASSA